MLTSACHPATGTKSTARTRSASEGMREGDGWKAEKGKEDHHVTDRWTGLSGN